ncbi:MAG TPA: hypothetical protein VGD40_02630 [Chryseosolibacter sp.]
MKHLIRTLWAMMLIVKGMCLSAQTPEVGKPFPEVDTKTTHVAELIAPVKLKGRWSMIEFWYMGCSSCIKSLSLMDSVQRRFGDRMNVIMIGYNGHDRWGRGVENFFDQFRKVRGLALRSQFDSAIFKAWKIRSMPYIFIVDPEGVTRFITDTRDITLENMESLLQGKEVRIYQRGEAQRTFTVPPISKTVFHSALAQWDGEHQWVDDVHAVAFESKGSKEVTYRLSMVPLYALYNEAFAGSFGWSTNDSLYNTLYPKLVLEVKDKTRFEYSYRQGKGLYNYSFQSYGRTLNKAELMSILQNELENAFGFKASIQTREVSVLHLVKIRDNVSQLRTKGGEPRIPSHSSAAGFSLQNVSMKTFLDRAMYYVAENLPPYFDVSGIDYNVDVSLQGDLTNIETLKQQLRTIGLDLMIATRPMKAIVVEDK